MVLEQALMHTSEEESATRINSSLQHPLTVEPLPYNLSKRRFLHRIIILRVSKHHSYCCLRTWSQKQKVLHDWRLIFCHKTCVKKVFLRHYLTKDEVHSSSNQIYWNMQYYIWGYSDLSVMQLKANLWVFYRWSITDCSRECLRNRKWPAINSNERTWRR